MLGYLLNPRLLSHTTQITTNALDIRNIVQVILVYCYFCKNNTPLA